MALLATPRTRALVVEDDGVIANEIAEQLTESGLDVVGIERSAEAAIAAAVHTRPDVVLMDVRLSGAMDGIDAASVIGARGIAPVIFLTAHSDAATIGRARAVDPYGYLIKPISNRDIGPAITMALNRFQLERRLRESEERFRGAFEYAAIGMILTSPDEHLLRVNDAFCKMLGYSPDELLNMTSAALTHADDRQNDMGYLQTMLVGEPHRHFEKRYLHKDGRIIEGRVALSLVRDIDGQPLYFVAQIEDITDRRIAEALLLERDLRYRITANLVPGFVFEGMMIDGSPQATWVSNGFKRVFDCSIEQFNELGARHFCDADTLVRIRAAMATLAQGLDLAIEVSLRSLDGVQRWLRVSARVIRAGSGFSEDRVFGVAEDVTERKRLERALGEATYQEHRRLGQEIHEGLGQELTGLALMAGALASQAASSNSPLADELTRLAAVTRHAIETCRNIARGVSPLTESRGSLTDSLRQIVELAVSSGHAGVQFSASEHAALRLPSDSCEQLYRVAQEALTNALKHSGADRIAVGIAIEEAGVRIDIVDNGRGFPKSKAPPAGRGIDGMRQRALAIGARLRVESDGPGRTAIVCECPQPLQGSVPGAKPAADA